jgi:hypothetical protein
MRYILLILGLLLCGWLFYNSANIQQSRDVTVNTNEVINDLRNLQALDRKVSDKSRALFIFIDPGENRQRFEALNNDPIQLGNIVPRNENPFLPLNTNYYRPIENNFNIINEPIVTDTPLSNQTN